LNFLDLMKFIWITNVLKMSQNVLQSDFLSKNTIVNILKVDHIYIWKLGRITFISVLTILIPKVLWLCWTILKLAFWLKELKLILYFFSYPTVGSYTKLVWECVNSFSKSFDKIYSKVLAFKVKINVLLHLAILGHKTLNPLNFKLFLL